MALKEGLQAIATCLRIGSAGLVGAFWLLMVYDGYIAFKDSVFISLLVLIPSWSIAWVVDRFAK